MFVVSLNPHSMIQMHTHFYETQICMQKQLYFKTRWWHKTLTFIFYNEKRLLDFLLDVFFFKTETRYSVFPWQNETSCVTTKISFLISNEVRWVWFGNGRDSGDSSDEFLVRRVICLCLLIFIVNSSGDWCVTFEQHGSNVLIFFLNLGNLRHSYKCKSFNCTSAMMILPHPI